MSLHIVLVEPEIPQNTGNIARTCAALGATLHLIHPLGFSIDSKQVRRAGLDYWYLLDIRQYDSLEAFLEEHAEDDLFLFTTKAENTYADIEYPEETYLLFGKETRGLPEALIISYATRAVRIPMIDDARSLNLSNCVAVAAYEYERQKGFKGLQKIGELHSGSWKDV